MTRPTRFDLILSVPLGLFITGCAGMGRTDLGPKTTPSLGDRQLSVTSGRPGEESLIRSGSIDTSITQADNRRISGRVIDQRGQPVSGATVRLADGALTGGQVSDVITDEAGGFTIRGLRHATPYTVIATLDLGSETRVARARFVSGETQARILIEPNSGGDAINESPVARNQPTTRPSVEPTIKQVSQKRTAQSSGPQNPPSGRWVYLLEDGTEAEVVGDTSTIPGKTPVRKATFRPDDEQEPEIAPDEEEDVVEATEPVQRPSKSSQKSVKKRVNSDWRAKGSSAKPPTGSDSNVRRTQYGDDDPENPLPPAIERKAYVYEEFEESEPIERIARSSTPPKSRQDRTEPRNPKDDSDALEPLRSVARPAEEVIVEEFDDTNDRPVRQSAQKPVSRDSRRVSEPLYTDSHSAGNLRVEDIEEANRIRRAQRGGNQVAGRSAKDAPESATVQRTTTWEQAQRPSGSQEPARTDGTVSRTNRSVNTLMAPDDLPPVYEDSDRFSDAGSRSLERPVSRRDEIEQGLSKSRQSSMMSQIEPDVARTDQERIDRLRVDQPSGDSAFQPGSPKTSSEWLNRVTSNITFWKKGAGSSTDSINSAFCDFDSTNQRLLDFELQDIKGRSVRFSQMPSELTLLFFWGTWCKPCHEAMPHLIELQKQLAADNVQVVGIAYEEGSSQDRQKKVAMAADRYGINFPLLMGGTTGAENCPVRKALDVRVYPTMVLLDRDGRVLWKDQGVTPASLGRLDKALASHLRQLDDQRYARGDNGRVTR